MDKDEHQLRVRMLEIAIPTEKCDTQWRTDTLTKDSNINTIKKNI